MGERSLLTFGPFTRAVSSVEPHLAPAECIAAGSLNYLVDPVAGGAFKRSGSSIVGDTVDGVTGAAVAGITESAPEWIPARLRSFKSDALADGASGGYPTPSVLYRREASATTWPAVDDGVFGTEYVRRAAANYVALSEFGVNCYPTGGKAHGAEIKYKVAPFWYESGDGGYSRGATEYSRRFFCSGSWSTIDAGRWRYYPSLRGTPLRWDGGCNDSSASIRNSIRVTPTGPLPPAWMPSLAATTSIAAASRTSEYPWKDGDAFFFSIIYQFEDGSWSAPVIPRPKTTYLSTSAATPALVDGYGWFVAGTIGGGNYYKTVNWTNLPVPPAGVTATALLRTRKMNFAAATDAVTVDISDLRICGVIKDRTQTSFVDSLADDDGLLLDADVVRYDTICPPRARHLGTGDNHVIAGYTLPNPLAIQLTISGVTANYDMNLDEASTNISGTTVPLYRVTATGLEIGLTTAGTAIAASLVIDWATFDTMQSVVDRINATKVAEGYGQWRAQLAPGVDPSAKSANLARTTITSSSSTSSASNSLIVDDATYDAVPLGYYIYDSNGKVNGLYVTGKLGGASGSKTLQLNSAGTAGSAAALVFYADCGDAACVTTAGSKGWIRVFGPSYPQGFVYFKRSALAGYDKPAKDRLYFTSSSPGAASTGVSLAANLWVASNRRDGVNDSGQVMGIVDIQGAAVIAYRKRIALFINERGSNTAEDFDYRIQTINDSRGCISPWSVVGVNGCAVYATNVGLCATDKSKREIGLTADIYQPIRGNGDMSYEFPKCVAAAASDSPDCWLSGAVWGNRLVYAYRVSASAYLFSVYDFSLGTDALGLESLANPDSRRPYGWSSSCKLQNGTSQLGPRAMGAVSASDGLRLYGALNDNAGTTDGRVDQLFTGATDNGFTITASLVTKTVVESPQSRFSAQNMTVLHKTVNATAGLTLTRALGSSAAYVLSNATGRDYVQETVQLTQDSRSPANYLKLQLDDNSADVGGLIWRVDLEVENLPTVGG